MKNLNTKKIILVVVSLVLVVGLVIGGTLMYLSVKTEPLANTFKATEVTCEIVEEFDGTEKKNVKITNTGDIDAYLRAAIIVNWVDASGNILGEEVPASAYTLSINTANWTEGNDGYYYLTGSVAPGATSAVLINFCRLKNNVTPPTGYYLSVTVLADAIQANPASAKTAAGWER